MIVRAACVRASVPGGGRAARLFLPWLNLTVVEHDIAVLKVASPEQLPCQQRRIWPACLPDKVRNITQSLMMVLRISARVLNRIKLLGTSVTNSI